MSLRFNILKTYGNARVGLIETKSGRVNTPNFMPVGSKGSVKGLTVSHLLEANVEILLCNTFHLFLRPTSKIIEKLGGIHRFMGFYGPILTDSGGYQAFSLSQLKKVTEEGIIFRSPVDGQKVLLTPELSIRTQEELGVDIAMVLDDLSPFMASKKEHELSVQRTARWAKRCKDAKRREEMAIFGIVQGGIYEDLREISAQSLIELDFEGYAAGGFCVGEEKSLFYKIASQCANLLPHNKVRYLMGVGKPNDIIEAVLWGYDLFDCVIPTRNARNGQLFTFKGKINIKKSEFKDDESPIEESCQCYTCKNYMRAYLNHLYRVNDPTYTVLSTIHNINFFMKLMKKIREAILTETILELKKEIEEYYRD